MSKVLVFESDAPFAEQLKTELQARSHQVTVIDDPSAGLQAAAADRPDLILLCVELPRMSGFSVCGKLKRDSNLKDVPVIILSSDASEETFEQHRRLRTRAEVYVKKPVSFGDLSQHMSAYLTPSSLNGDDVLIDDEVDFDDSLDSDVELVESQPAPEVTLDETMLTDGLSEPAPEASLSEPAPSAPLSEAAAFANQALDSLLDDDQAQQTLNAPPPSSRRGSDVASLQQQLAIAQAELDNARGRLGMLDRVSSELEKATAKLHDLESAAPDATQITELQTQISQLTHRCEQAESKASEYENKLHTAPKSEELHRLQKDLDDTRAKGGATAREFLELREQINRKDKEMLDLRDQLTGKDKELLNLRDASLAQERAQADLLDRVAEVDKQLHELQRSVEPLKADKEQAAKRAEDFKKRGDKVAAELETLIQERKTEREKHESEIATRKASEAAAKADHEAALNRLLGEQDAKIQSATQAAREQAERTLGEAHEQALNEKDAALIKVLEEKSAALSQATQAHDQAIALLREELERNTVSRIAERAQELKKEHDNTLAALHRANEALLEQQRHEQQAAFDKISQELALVRGRYDKLRAAWDENNTALGQMKESLQSALTKLTEIGERTVD